MNGTTAAPSRGPGGAGNRSWKWSPEQHQGSQGIHPQHGQGLAELRHRAVRGAVDRVRQLQHLARHPEVAPDKAGHLAHARILPLQQGHQFRIKARQAGDPSQPPHEGAHRAHTPRVILDIQAFHGTDEEIRFQRLDEEPVEIPFHLLRPFRQDGVRQGDPHSAGLEFPHPVDQFGAFHVRQLQPRKNDVHLVPAQHLQRLRTGLNQDHFPSAVALPEGPPDPMERSLRLHPPEGFASLIPSHGYRRANPSHRLIR